MSPLKYIWEEADNRERADKVLARRIGLSRSRLQELSAAGKVHVAGKAHDLKGKIAVGTLIEVLVPEPVSSDVEAEDLPLEVLFEDRDLIVLNKKAGMVVHPGAGHSRGTLVSALLHHCKGGLSGIGGVERPGIVHRLDKDTSGILVAAKSDASHQGLAGQFQGRDIEKYYMAWVVPGPKAAAGSWTGAIGRHPVHRQKMTILRDGGRSARTDFVVRQRSARAALLELRIYTGRTHQIRVHCAAAGCPVAGDMLYGRKISWVLEAGVTRQMLHAARLIFNHPRNGKRIELSAPLPEDFVKFGNWLNEHGT